MSPIVPERNMFVTLWQEMTRDGHGFSAITNFVTIAGTTETDFMLIRNPAASGVLARLKEFIMTIGGSASNTSIFRFYRSPTVTSDGTPITVNKVLSIGTPTNQVLCFQTPTISARGTLVQLFAVDFESFSRDQELSRYLAEGSQLLVTVQGSVTNIEHNLVFTWAEEIL